MINISYRKKDDGSEYAVWPGKSVRVHPEDTDDSAKETPAQNTSSKKQPTKVRKVGQMYLGKPVDKDKLIFFSEKEGYFRFDPADQSIHEADPSDIPGTRNVPYMDFRFRPSLTSVRFGGSYFINRLIFGTGYNEVIDQIKYQNRDSLYAMIHFHLLSDLSDSHASEWRLYNYVRYLYPKANINSRRLTEFYKAIGKSDNRIAFLRAHIKYALKTDPDCMVIIDSTGCQNVCDVPETRMSRHGDDKNVEFRTIVLVQRTTGLPLYYEKIMGNVIDIATVEHVIRMAKHLGLYVSGVLGDAGYYCPRNLESLVLSGIDFMGRLNPTYTLYQTVYSEHKEELDKVKPIKYKGRSVKVLKVPSVIATNKETGEEVMGYVYLCRDIEAWHLKNARMHSANKKKKNNGLTAEELEEAGEVLGVFAIVDTRDLPPEEVLPEYYSRQKVEQFFDDAKNYGKLMPVRGHSSEGIDGRLLLSFIVTFIAIVIKNRMNIMDLSYAAIPEQLKDTIADGDEKIVVDLPDNKEETVIAQKPLMYVFNSSPCALFSELEYVNATYFEAQKGANGKDDPAELVPSPIQKSAKDYLEAFGLICPEGIWFKENGEMVVVHREGERETCTRAKAFSRKPISTDETIAKKREQDKQKKVEKLKKELGIADQNPEKELEKEAKKKTAAGKSQKDPEKKPSGDNGDNSEESLKAGNVVAGQTMEQKSVSEESSSKGETAEQAAPENVQIEMAQSVSGDNSLEETGTDTDRQGERQKAKGSKDKKTLENKAEQRAGGAEGEISEKRRPGRPKGSKNKKTLEREAELKRLAAESRLPEKRRPGRPKGSKNKKTLEREVREAGAQS